MAPTAAEDPTVPSRRGRRGPRDVASRGIDANPSSRPCPNRGPIGRRDTSANSAPLGPGRRVRDRRRPTEHRCTIAERESFPKHLPARRNPTCFVFTLRADAQPDNVRQAAINGGGALSGVSSQTHAWNRHALAAFAVLGIALAVTACGASGTTAGSSSSRQGVVTTLPGNETCEGRAPQNASSPDAYRQQYADDLASPLKDRLRAYDSAIASGDWARIGQAAGALDTDIRADARLVDIPRLYGCYDQKVLARLQNATESFATTLDAMSCASANMCNRKQTEVPALVAQAAPQERSAVEAFNAYAAQFGGEQIPAPRASAGARSWRV